MADQYGSHPARLLRSAGDPFTFMNAQWEYRFARLKYSGVLLWLPIAVFLIVIGHYKRDENLGQTTARSVSVSGYYRRDGTHINSYNRRPAGDVPHDAPYERAAFFWGALCFVGYCAGGWVSIRLLFFSADELLPSKHNGISIPHHIRVPVQSAYSRKDWNCLCCRLPIPAGHFYYYFTEGSGYGSSRQRYCPDCHKKMIEQEKLTLEVRSKLVQEIFGIKEATNSSMKSG